MNVTQEKISAINAGKIRNEEHHLNLFMASVIFIKSLKNWEVMVVATPVKEINWKWKSTMS